MCETMEAPESFTLDLSLWHHILHWFDSSSYACFYLFKKNNKKSPSNSFSKCLICWVLWQWLIKPSSINFKKGPPLECGVPPDPIVEGVYISMSLLVKTTFLPLIWVKDERRQRFDAGKRDWHLENFFVLVFWKAETKIQISKICTGKSIHNFGRRFTVLPSTVSRAWRRLKETSSGTRRVGNCFNLCC